jgi:integrase/recombinase XerC
MDRLVRARVLLAEAAALGVTIEDLIAESSASPGSPTIAPTVAEYVQIVNPTFSKGTADTYQSYWRLAVLRLGDCPIDSIGVDDCEGVVADAVERARRNRPGTDGRSARENCIGALRALFARAERAGLVAKSPAGDLEKPRRLPNRRRALEDHELREVIDAVRTTSHDPDLDLLIIRFHLESGARREGALNLRLRDLDGRRSTVWLREKFDTEREQPISPSLLQALQLHTSSRGAMTADDSVLRGRSGRPITRRRYNTVFDRARPCLPWAERTPVSAHILRHTAITAVERHAGFAVAQAFAGHSASSVTGTYTRARLAEVAAAVAVLTGEAHPLAVD